MKTEKTDKPATFWQTLSGRSRVALVTVLTVVTVCMVIWACSCFMGNGADGGGVMAGASSEFLFHGATFSRDEIIRMEAAFAAGGLKDYRVSDGKVEIPVARRDQYIMALQKNDALPHGENAPAEAATKGILPPTGKELEHQRTLAKQHSLARQIEKFRGIESAQVTLDFQQKMTGLAQTRTATASVVVRSRPGVELQEMDIQAIRGVVAGSVADLKAENLVVVDSRVNRCWEWTRAEKPAFRENAQENSGDDARRQGRHTYASWKIRTLDDATFYVLKNGRRGGSGQDVQVLPVSYTSYEAEKTPEKIAEPGFPVAEPVLTELPFFLTDDNLNENPGEKIAENSPVLAKTEPTGESAEKTAESPANTEKSVSSGGINLYEAGIGVLIFAVAGFLAAVMGNVFSRGKKAGTEEAVSEESISCEAETETEPKTEAETQPVECAEPEEMRETPLAVMKVTACEEAALVMEVAPVTETPVMAVKTEEKTVENDEIRLLSETLFWIPEEKKEKTERNAEEYHPAAHLPHASGGGWKPGCHSGHEKTAAPVMPAQPVPAPRKSLRDLKSAPAEYVAEVLSGEREQVAALVMRHVDDSQREAVLAHFPPETQREIRGRLAECGWADEEILNEVLDSVAARVYALMPAGRPVKPFSLEREAEPAASEPVKIFLEDEYRDAILAGCASVEKRDEPVMADLPQTLRMPETPQFTLPAGMTYDDVADFPEAALRTILQEADPETAMYGFVSACPRLKERFLSVMPPRYAVEIKACMKEMAPMRVCDLEESRRRMMTVISDLAATGKIEIPAQASRKAA